MNNMLGLLAGAGLPVRPPGGDTPLPDSSEQIYIAPVALLKMLKHGTKLTNRRPILN